MGQEAANLVKLMVEQAQKYKQQKASERATAQEPMYREKVNIEEKTKQSGLVKESTANKKAGKEEKRKQESKYIVKKRDNLYKIAKEHGISYSELIAANPQITDPNLIYPNQVINIPTKAAASFNPTSIANVGNAANDKSPSESSPHAPNTKPDVSLSVHNSQDQNPTRFIDASGAAYSRKKDDKDYTRYYKNIIDRGYEKFHEKHGSNGFSAIAFKKQMPDGKIEVIIAYSGTDLPTANPKTWKATAKDIIGNDAYIFLGKIPKQQANAFNFAKEALGKVSSNNVDVIFTGHSLGAVLAQLTAIERGKGERAIVFDSPGVKNLVTKPYDHKTITIYNGLPNPINSFGEHTVNPIIIYEKGTACLGCIFSGSIKGHQLKNFYNAYNQDGALKSSYKEMPLPINTQGKESKIYLPEYRDYLDSMWLYQYRYNFFSKLAVPGFPEFSSQMALNQLSSVIKASFRQTYPTSQSYIEAVINYQSNNKNNPR